MKTRKCNCEYCKLSRILQRAIKKLTPAENKAIDTIWEHMEGAEFDIDWLNAEAKDGEPISVGGRIYVPKETFLDDNPLKFVH